MKTELPVCLDAIRTIDRISIDFIPYFSITHCMRERNYWNGKRSGPNQTAKHLGTELRYEKNFQNFSVLRFSWLHSLHVRTFHHNGLVDPFVIFACTSKCSDSFLDFLLISLVLGKIRHQSQNHGGMHRTEYQVYNRFRIASKNIPLHYE